MNNVFQVPESAMRPFYVERVGWRGERPGPRVLRGTFAACVLDSGYDANLTSFAGSTERRAVCIMLPRTGAEAWHETTPPQTGDVFTRGAVSYAAYSVEETPTEYVVEAREQ